jgi:hypothetical protein
VNFLEIFGIEGVDGSRGWNETPAEVHGVLEFNIDDEEWLIVVG